MSSIPAKVLRELHRRSEGLCEGCGVAPATEAHHRQFRSRGGKHVVENLLDLCGWGNHTGCHGRAHSASPPLGHAVHSWEDPLEIPVAYRGREVFMNPDGSLSEPYRNSVAF